jgi:hypothetical protein
MTQGSSSAPRLPLAALLALDLIVVLGECLARQLLTLASLLIRQLFIACAQMVGIIVANSLSL